MTMPKCDRCEYFFDYVRGKGITCEAFPDGQPEEFNPWGDEKEPCTPEYTFYPKDKSELDWVYTPTPGGIFEKFIDKL